MFDGIHYRHCDWLATRVEESVGQAKAFMPWFMKAHIICSYDHWAEVEIMHACTIIVFITVPINYYNV